MKKKGFTLVELLAVIAILAMLVLIVLPNIMGMFNTAKKNSFTTEVKEIFKTAEQAWMNDNLDNTNETVYSNVHNGQCGKILSLTGRTILEYYIKINKAGKIVQFYATDGTYQYYYEGNGLKIEEINNVEATTNSNALKKLEKLCGFSSEDEEEDNAPKVTDTTPGVLEGEGTSQNPYKIESMEDLVAFSQAINNKKYRTDGMKQEIVDNAYIYYYKYFTLETDLDFKSKNSYVNYEDTSLGDINLDGTVEGIMKEVNSGNGFPMISKTKNQTFGAAFDGKYHLINHYNHKIVETDPSKTVDSSFWGYSSDLLYLANITFDNVDIDIDVAGSANISVALLESRYLNTYNIRNLTIEGNIKARCGNDCNVAGALGNLGGQGATNRFINNLDVRVNIDVKGKNANVGGITSSTNTYGYISNNTYFMGNINVEATEKAEVAGLAANAENYVCVNSGAVGNINVKAKNAYVFGLGKAQFGERQNGVSSNGIIANSFYRGNITVDASNYSIVGGLSKTKVFDSYFIGNITQNNSNRSNSSNTALISSYGPVDRSYAIGNITYKETSIPSGSANGLNIGLVSGYDTVSNCFARGKLNLTQVSNANTTAGYVSGFIRNNPNVHGLVNSYYSQDSSYINNNSVALTNIGTQVSVNDLKNANWYTNTLKIGNMWVTRDGYYPQLKKCDYIANGYVCRVIEDFVINQDWIKVEN